MGRSVAGLGDVICLESTESQYEHSKRELHLDCAYLPTLHTGITLRDYDMLVQVSGRLWPSTRDM